MKKNLMGCAAIAALMCASVPAFSATLTAQSAFTSIYGGTADANFAFGYAAAVGGAISPFTTTGLVGGSQVKGLYNNAADFTPGVFFNDTGMTQIAAGTVTLAPGQLALHPGRLSVPSEIYSVVQYTNTGATGLFSLDAAFTAGAANPAATTDITLTINGVAVGLPGDANTDFSGTYLIPAGGTLSLYVGPTANDHGSDTSALVRGITVAAAVPLPASVMGGGVLLAGMALSRRRK